VGTGTTRVPEPVDFTAWRGRQSGGTLAAHDTDVARFTGAAEHGLQRCTTAGPPTLRRGRRVFFEVRGRIPLLGRSRSPNTGPVGKACRRPQTCMA
jgi:hypothetical protein